ncbi:hypothetical protein SAMN04487983_103650 [Streptomyces sp. yr375]|uniref:hypothetical protein n=1 Tax=Streptomyces sp. yr375 TaxID=1761906 RepID=UPI0008BD66DA|nr:hypothetical protein [Streptomyces sp. yr375]SES21148.1 hypothetical protein SAMN04487983_103650 [Streptomyces sp. yr375]
MSNAPESPATSAGGLRLLPWTNLDGKPCYLDTDDDQSRLSLLADNVEASQLASAEHVLAGAKAVLADTKAGERAVRFALTRAAESLADVMRIAVSRGERIPAGVSGDGSW